MIEITVPLAPVTKKNSMRIMRNKKTRKPFIMPTRRRVDLTNLLESIDDVLVRAGVLKDDHSGIIVSHDGSRVLYDKDNPRTEVSITAYE